MPAVSLARSTTMLLELWPQEDGMQPRTTSQDIRK